MKARWDVVSKKLQWNGIVGKDCCIPTVSSRNDICTEGDFPSDAEDNFAKFALENSGSYAKFKDGAELVAYMQENSRRLDLLMGILPRDVKWAISSSLAEGRTVELRCLPLDID